jgi:hypothetical protein
VILAIEVELGHLDGQDNGCQLYQARVPRNGGVSRVEHSDATKTVCQVVVDRPVGQVVCR